VCMYIMRVYMGVGAGVCVFIDVCMYVYCQASS
jgi:hypothetical protein